MNVTDEALEARKRYQREYRARNRDRINESQRRRYNPEKRKQYVKTYWEKKAREGLNSEN